MRQWSGRLSLMAALAAGGVLFSGYLSGVKFFSETCAFNESCPYFLGYPACYYGFALFAGIALVLGALRFGFLAYARAVRYAVFISGIGVMFSGYFTFEEIPRIASEGLSAYLLGLPTCAYGFLAFVAVFCIALAANRSQNFPPVE